MGEDNGGPPLSRRVPGAARSGPVPVARVALPESLLLRMQAAVEAERTHVEVPDQEQTAKQEPVALQNGAARTEPAAVPPSRRDSGKTHAPKVHRPKPQRQPKQVRQAKPPRQPKPQPQRRQLQPPRQPKPPTQKAEPAQPELPDASPVSDADQEAVTQPISVISASASSEMANPVADAISAEPVSVAEPDRAAEPPADHRRPAAVRAPAQNRPRQQASAREALGSRRRRLAVLSVAVIVLIASGTIIIALSQHTAAARPGGASSGGGPLAGLRTRNQAASWVVQQVDHGAIVACDPTMCNRLAAGGFPSGHLRKLGPASSYPLQSTVVIVTPAVRSQFGTSLGSEYAPAVLAAFGPRNGQIDVRVIDPHGAAAYRTELGKDLQVRKEAGASLLGYKSIVFSASAGRQLADGEVDSRLIEAIASLAGQVPVDILGFSNMAPGASPGLPLRFADLAETDGAAHMARSAYTRSMLAILGAEHPLYLRPAHTETVQLNGQAVLRIEFAAPSPLLLLGPQAS